MTALFSTIDIILMASGLIGDFPVVFAIFDTFIKEEREDLKRAEVNLNNYIQDKTSKLEDESKGLIDKIEDYKNTHLPVKETSDQGEGQKGSKKKNGAVKAIPSDTLFFELTDFVSFVKNIERVWKAESIIVKGLRRMRNLIAVTVFIAMVEFIVAYYLIAIPPFSSSEGAIVVLMLMVLFIVVFRFVEPFIEYRTTKRLLVHEGLYPD